MTWLNLPNLFKANTIKLRISILPQIEFFHNFFWKWTSTTFSENGLLSQDFDSSLKILFNFSFFRYSEISSCNAFYTSIIIIENFWAWSSWVNINAQLLSSLTHPLWKLAQRCDVISLISESFWKHKMRYFSWMFIVQKEIKVIRCYRGRNWRWVILHGFPIRKKLGESLWLKAVSTEDMITNLSSFFDEAYINWSIVLFLFLFELNGSCKSCNSSTYNHDVVLQLLPRR